MPRFLSLLILLLTLSWLPSLVNGQVNPFCGWGMACPTPTPSPTPTPGPTLSCVCSSCTATTPAVCSGCTCITPIVTPPVVTPPPVTPPTPGTLVPPTPRYATGGTGCFGGVAKAFTLMVSNQYGDFMKSDIAGGSAPDGTDPNTTRLVLGSTYFFAGIAGDGTTVWGPRYGDVRSFRYPTDNAIDAAMATVQGVKYKEVTPFDSRTGSCPIYQAGAPNWPAPGSNYAKVGTSGAANSYSIGPGLPLFARSGTNALTVRTAIQLTGGQP